MTTLTVSYFKNHGLRLLDDVQSTGETLMITRRGKPLAQVQPVSSRGPIALGKLKGTIEITGDIVTPLGEEDWTACQ